MTILFIPDVPRDDDLDAADIAKIQRTEDLGGLESGQYVSDLDRAMADVDSDFDLIIKNR
jgi:hypothetical protein